MKYITIQKASDVSGLSQSMIRRMIESKELTAYKMDRHKRIFVNVSEIESKIKPLDSSFDVSKFLV